VTVGDATGLAQPVQLSPVDGVQLYVRGTAISVALGDSIVLLPLHIAVSLLGFNAMCAGVIVVYRVSEHPKPGKGVRITANVVGTGG
jgi:hypothetical protein